jgi:hypothetical protein
MKDVENGVFTIVSDTLRAAFPGIFVTGDIVNAPSQFPCVAFYEDDNYFSREDLDSGESPKIAVLRYRADVFSNKVGGRKAEAKAILDVIQEVLYARNFTRFSRTPIADMGEKIYHMVEVYRVKTDGDAFYRI